MVSYYSFFPADLSRVQERFQRKLDRKRASSTGLNSEDSGEYRTILKLKKIFRVTLSNKIIIILFKPLFYQLKKEKHVSPKLYPKKLAKWNECQNWQNEENAKNSFRSETQLFSKLLSNLCSLITFSWYTFFLSVWTDLKLIK